MFWPFRKRPGPDPEDPLTLLLKPQTGYGDHLMLSAVIEGLKAERPEYRVFVAANHPEMFWNNPHVEVVQRWRRVRKHQPELASYYRPVKFRTPEERYLQVSGHLIDDMYACLEIPLQNRPHQPRIYLTEKELKYEQRRLESLPRPRIAIVSHGKASVNLPNKIYPPDQWAELGGMLVDAYPAVLHLGSSEDGPLMPGALDFRDIGYRRTASVLRHCDLLVTHVGGIMHLAAALRVPAVVLYGAAEHPAISGYGWNRNVYVPIECGPCWMRTPCSHLSCMRRLTPQVAMDEVRTALAEMTQCRVC